MVGRSFREVVIEDEVSGVAIVEVFEDFSQDAQHNVPAVIVKEEITIVSCLECNLDFKSQKDLDKHRRTHEKKFLKVSKLPKKKGIIKKSNQPPDTFTECLLCFMKFADINILKHHIRLIHSAPKQFKKDENSKILPKQQSKKVQVKKNKQKKEVKVETHKPELVEQEVLASEETNFVFECDQCDWIFTEKSSFIQHKQNDHENEKPKLQNSPEFSCKMCDESCKTKPDLMIHQRIHYKAKYNCDICNLNYKTSGNMKRHQELKHGKVYNYKRTEKFKTSASISSQSLKNNSSKKHQIESKENLKAEAEQTKRHKRRNIPMNSKERKWKCQQCDWKFLSKSLLNRHIDQVHFNIRPFHCTLCNRSFKGSGDLKVHYRVHNKLRKFKCDHCSFRFNFKISLKRHTTECHKPDLVLGL